MRHLYFIRHGESIINVQGIWANVTGSPFDLGLTETGQHQALDAAKACQEQHLHFGLILISPLKRAQETAAVIAGEIHFPVNKLVIQQLVTERKYAGLEGTSFDEFFRHHEYKDLDDVPGNETIEELHQRAIRAFAYLKCLEAVNVLVVSHAAFGRALRRVIQSLPASQEYTDRENILSGVANFAHGGVVQLI